MARIRHTPAPDRETLIKNVRKAVDAAGGRDFMTMRKFLSVSGIRKHDILKHFAKWADLLKEAGIEAGPCRDKLDAETLLADWGAVTRKLGHCPSQSEYKVHGKYDPNTQRRRVAWMEIPEAFRKFAEKKREWADVLPLVEKSEAELKIRGRGGRMPGTTRRVIPRLPDRHSCGAPLDFGALRHAPTSESGVIFLFGMLAEKLGFVVEALQTGYPDCHAKRRTGTALPSSTTACAESWQNVAIEFEYESKNFYEHGHPPERCDIIVCWRHNWADCPENLEVIALGEEIKKFAA